MTADPHAERVAALTEVLHEVFGDDGGAHASTEATTCRYCEDYATRLLASPAMRDLLAEERARALREAADDARWARDEHTHVRHWLRTSADRETP